MEAYIMKSIYKLNYLAIFILVLFVFTFYYNTNIVAIANNAGNLPTYITENELKQFAQKDTAIKLQLLYNLDNEPEYIIAYKENSIGYEIYSRISGTMLEASIDGENPYVGIDKGYYLTALSYASGNLANLKDIKTGHRYTKAEKNSIKHKQNSLKQKHIKKQKQNKVDTSRDTNPTSTILYDINDISFEFTTSELNSFTTVEHPEVFMRLYSNSYFGANTAGSCAAVAANLLYLYADYVYGGIVPQLTPAHWISATNGHTVLDTEYDASSNPCVPYDCTISNTASSFTFSNLHKYLIYLSGVTQFGISDSQILRAIQLYNQEVNNKGCIYLEVYSARQTSSVNDIYDLVNSNIIIHKTPVKISIFSSISTTGKSRHSVVAYGTKCVNNEYYFRIHTGWGNPNNCIINGDFINTIDGHYMQYLTVNRTSSHSISYSNAKHVCPNTNCYANDVTHRYYSISTTQHGCVCGYTANHFLLNLEVNGEGNIVSGNKCLTCGYHA